MTDRPLRIGFVTPEYPTEGSSGGIGSYVRQMVHALSGLGHFAVVIMYVQSGEGVAWDGPIPIYKLKASGFASRFPWPLGRSSSSVALALQISKLAKQLDLDLLEAAEWFGLTAFLNVTKPRKLRVVVRLHTCSAIIRRINKSVPGSLRERFQNYKLDWAERRSILTADGVTAVAKAIGEETKTALKLPRSDFRVVPNSVVDSAFSSNEYEEGGGDPVVLFVGRLEWRKGPDLLIKAVPAILRRFPNARFRLAGLDTPTAPEGKSMKAYLESLLPEDARPHVEFCGHLSAPQIAEELRLACVCAFPSRYEGLPMVCLEAMARGKAIAATDIPGFRELISDGETGLIVNQEDPESLASALSRLIADPASRRRFGNGARQVARSRFHATEVAKSMLQVYRDLIDGVEDRSPQQLSSQEQVLR